ncbi:MAG: DUF1700 domain-containing protein [Clostridia bacterium]|nr:DUF1700 domain-containing protein [Clostridia bacterium]
MTKLKFLLSLNEKLSGLPKEEVEERLNFYSEMIEDRMEEGLSEEEAVAEIGSIDEIAAHIVDDIPLSKIAKEKIRPKRYLKAWEIVLLAVGSPLWLVLGLSAFAIVIALYAVIWSLVVSAWAVFASLSAVGAVGIPAGILFAINGNILSGIALASATLVSGGLAIFAFIGCMAATKGTVLLTKKIIFGIKKSFIKKEETL